MTQRFLAVAAVLAAFGGLTGASFAQDSGQSPPPPANQTPPPPAPASNDPDSEKKSGPRRPPIGLELGIFEPSAGKARSRFGDTWFSYGVSFGTLRQANRHGAFEVEYNLFSSKRGDNSAYLIPIGIGYRRSLAARDDQSTVPYVIVSGDVYGTLLKSVQDNIGYGWRTAYGGSAGIGTAFGGHAYVELRYLGISTVRDLDLSGLQLHGGFRF